ncbi:phosphoenolpyruvate synthase [Streptococcus varani]|uniref:Phosphoenolpyruvate synthase n=1 Tax=Streptococcus varani TaxID=1608583 RepID=A0A0E4CS85_9STRE|nr:phosphoenolpyruvate synthase [Streptococcus varani]
MNILCQHLKKKALIGIAYRESSRLNRTRIYGMVRQIFRDIGQDLVKKQIIDQVEDVFFLTKEEIFNLENLENPSSLIATRKEKLVDDQAIVLARRLVFNEKIVEKRASQTQHFKQNSSGDLHGIGCSKGLVRGRVLVVDSLQDLSDVRGKILITKMTDPGWVYALMQAKGVIAEQGSLLSHTAIISRELGIPSIVNVPNVTKILQSGQHIEMDGRSGLIRRLTDD